MYNININDADIAKIIKKLDDFEKKVKNTDELFNLVGEKWVSQIQKSFVNSEDPYGNKWKKVQRNGRPLLDSGRLVGSINYVYSKKRLTVAANVIYGRTHNEGLRGVAKRQFIPLVNDTDFKNSNLNKSLNEIVTEYYMGLLNE